MWHSMRIQCSTPWLDVAVLSAAVSASCSNIVVWCAAAGVADALSVIIGCEMLKIVPGRVSTEVGNTTALFSAVCWTPACCSCTLERACPTYIVLFAWPTSPSSRKYNRTHALVRLLTPF